MNVTLTQTLVTLISYCFAYVIVVTLVGTFRAWMADRMGDPTAKDAGCMSLNPAVHIDPVGFAFGIFFYILLGFIIGWGRYVMINPRNIEGVARWPRIILAFFSNTIGYLILALISIVLLISIFDVNILAQTRFMIMSENLVQLPIAHAYPHHSPLAITIGFILIFIIYLSILLGVVYSFVNIFSLSMFYIAEKEGGYPSYSPYTFFFVPLIVIVLFSHPLRNILTYAVMYLGYIIAKLLHIG